MPNGVSTAPSTGEMEETAVEDAGDVAVAVAAEAEVGEASEEVRRRGEGPPLGSRHHTEPLRDYFV